MTVELVSVVVQLIFLEGVLSLDNAAVLGAMVLPLPTDQPVPWPRFLRRPGRRLDLILGPQRMAALKVGLLGAYVGRGLMLMLASYVIRNPWLRLAGALYLFYLAVKYLGELRQSDEMDANHDLRLPNAANFWSIVAAIELADLAFSLDNVVAAVVLSDHFGIVLLGVAIGIVMMRFAAGIFSRLMDWEPALAHAAYLLILAISVELMLADLLQIHLGEWVQLAISAGIVLLTIAFARVASLRPLNALWTPVLKLAGIILALAHWLTWPLRYVAGLVLARRAAPVTRYE